MFRLDIMAHCKFHTGNELPPSIPILSFDDIFDTACTCVACDPRSEQFYDRVCQNQFGRNLSDKSRDIEKNQCHGDTSLKGDKTELPQGMIKYMPF